MSVTDYIRRLRLTDAARRLKDSEAKVIDVALDSHFESVDGFQRAFLREFGVNVAKKLHIILNIAKKLAAMSGEF